MPNTVSHVFDGSSPTEVVDVIVGRIPVEVSAFHAGRTQADEGFKYESVNVHVLAAPFSEEIDAKIPFSGDVRSEDAPDKRTPVRSDTLHAPVVGDFINTFVSDNREPDFDVDFGNNTGRIHDAFFL